MSCSESTIFSRAKIRGENNCEDHSTSSIVADGEDESKTHKFESMSSQSKETTCESTNSSASIADVDHESSSAEDYMKESTSLKGTSHHDEAVKKSERDCSSVGSESWPKRLRNLLCSETMAGMKKPVEVDHRLVELHLLNGQIRTFSVSASHPYLEVTVKDFKEMLAKTFDETQLCLPRMFKLFLPAKPDTATSASRQHTKKNSEPRPDLEDDIILGPPRDNSTLLPEKNEKPPLIPKSDADPLDDSVILFATAPDRAPEGQIRDFLRQERRRTSVKSWVDYVKSLIACVGFNRQEEEDNGSESTSLAKTNRISLTGTTYSPPEIGTVKLCVAVSPGYTVARMMETMPFSVVGGSSSSCSASVGQHPGQAGVDGEVRLKDLEEALEEIDKKFRLPALLQDIVRMGAAHK